MPPDPPSMGRLRGSHMGFLHKLGNPLPKILDPPLSCIQITDYIAMSHTYGCTTPTSIFYHMQRISLTCARAPGSSVFLHVTLKNWEWPGDKASILPCIKLMDLASYIT